MPGMEPTTERADWRSLYLQQEPPHPPDARADAVAWLKTAPDSRAAALVAGLVEIVDGYRAREHAAEVGVEHEAMLPRVVGSTPKGRTLVAVAEVLEAHEVPGFTSLADVITDRLFDEGVIAPPPRLVAVCIRCRVSAPAIDTPWCRQCLEDTLASAIGPTTARDALEALDTLVAGR